MYDFPAKTNYWNREIDNQITLPCYHLLTQYKMEVSLSSYWKEYVSPVYMKSLINDKEELKITLACGLCGEYIECFSFQDVEPFILSQEVKCRLYLACTSYWEEKHPGKQAPYRITKTTDTNLQVTHTLFRWENYMRDQYAVKTETFDGDGQTNYFCNFKDAIDYFERL